MENFIPRGTLTRKDRIKNKVSQVYPFSACALSVDNDINLNLIYRSLANFAGLEMFVVGSQNWHKGATNGLKEVLKITHFQNINQFINHIKKTDYDLVAIEQSEKSVSLPTFQHPKKPCFIFGNESFGLGDDVLLNVDRVVEIPMNGFHPCANVGVSAGIIFYDFCEKYKQNTNNR